MIKEKIQKIVERAIHKKYPDFHDRENQGIKEAIEIPKDKSHGDYSSNIAFVMSKELGKNPQEIAQILTDELLKSPVFKDVKMVGGFINFFLQDEFFVENIQTVLLQKEKFGKNDFLKNKKVIIEYTDPNPFKEFHIGHLMSNAIGESLSRLIEFQGAKVKRACYQGDVGLHVAKAIWGKLRDKKLSWQEAYVLGSKEYQESDHVKQEIIALNKKVFERSDKEVNAVYDQGKKWSLAYFEKIYKKLGTKFDYYFFESQVADFGKNLVVKGIDHAIFQKGERGAIIFPGEKFGLHTRVFVNAEGLPTYEAKELGLAKIKYDKYNYDTSVIVTGNEVNEYFKVLMCAMAQIFPELQKRTTHMGHGMLRLPEGKMSSRTGKVITAESLLEKLSEMVVEKMADRDLSKKEKEKIKEAVAVGAIKYSILKQSLGSDIIYDFEKSINFQGDSGPYLQYSYARAMSVLQKAKIEKIKGDPNLQITSESTNKNVSELEKMMAQFPEIIQKAGKELEPHVVVLYLTELAGAFNAYYAQHKIVDKNDEFSPYKVALTQAFSIIMENGLWLLGIPVLEKM